jgi:hypothetical protein
MTKLAMQLILAALAFGGAVHAKDVKWDDLCELAKQSPLELKLGGGVTVKGVCLEQRDDTLMIATSAGRMPVNRDAILAVRQENMRPLCTPHDAGNAAAFLILVPVFALGDWVVPLLPVLVAAAGAAYVVVLPVCGVFDLIHFAAGSHAITII